MKKLIQVLGVTAGIWLVAAAPGFAGDPLGGLLGGLRGLPGGGGGGPAPAPAIGAGALGLLVAGGVASYIRGRRRG
jgi:hypothetical protein